MPLPITHGRALLGALAWALTCGLAACGSGDDVNPNPTPNLPASEATTPASSDLRPSQPMDEDEADAAVLVSTEVPKPTPSNHERDTVRGLLAAMPIYYLGDVGNSIRLFREFRTIEEIDADPIRSALWAMMDPGFHPLDADFSSPWLPPQRMDVSRNGDTLTVDVGSAAFGGAVGSESAELAVQQLIYTATAVAASTGAPSASSRSMSA